MLHAGVNEDESGRMSLDGVIAHVAGAMRGEFNLRFGQPSKDICFVMPELFPFTDTPQVDPVTGRSGGLLARLDESGMAPRTMFVNTSAEYWRGDAALIHTDLETMADAREQEYVRRYHFAGTQHGSGTFPPQETRLADNVIGQVPYNAVDYNPLLRACLVNLDRWVTADDPAPPEPPPLAERRYGRRVTHPEGSVRGYPGRGLPAQAHAGHQARLRPGPGAWQDHQAPARRGRDIPGPRVRCRRRRERGRGHPPARRLRAAGDQHRLESASSRRRQPRPGHRRHRRPHGLDAALRRDPPRARVHGRPASSPSRSATPRRTTTRPGWPMPPPSWRPRGTCWRKTWPRWSSRRVSATGTGRRGLDSLRVYNAPNGGSQ